MNNLINVIGSPTRITSHSKSLIDVVIINNSKENRLVEVLDIGYSVHLSQYVCMKSQKAQERPKIMYKRQFTNMNVNYFKHLMYDEKSIEVVESYEPKSSFMTCINIFIYNNNNNKGSRGMGDVAPLYGVDSALVLTNPGVQ